tara:strand:- start:716 stop:1447 length:732 start_codon:yes stop_codon:yes gene_type:complete
MRWKCECSYDGTDYFGWQCQPGQVSVQSKLQGALERVFKDSVSIHGSGRTDAGVHALGQVFHFDREWRHGPAPLLRALETSLPRSIRVLNAVEVGDDFHARFSAKTKRYRYRLFLGSASPFDWDYCWSVSEWLDINLMGDAIGRFVGEHDFAGFAANRGEEYESTVRRMDLARIVQRDGFLDLEFEANGFMYKMVRSLAGALVNVGLGRMKLDEFDRVLDSGKRSPLVLVAPAQGLFLEKVFY